MISRRMVSQALAAAALAPSVMRARAQGAYPGNLTIKLVVPYPPGGATDVIGRIVAERLAVMWRTTVIVENVSGAAGSIGMDRVAKGPTDGTQILVVPPQIAINQFLYAKLAFDPEKDLLPVAQVASLPNILVIRKTLEVGSVADFIAYAKANPGKLNYASAGNGTTSHLCAELLKRMTGIDAQSHSLPRQRARRERRRGGAGRPDVRQRDLDHRAGARRHREGAGRHARSSARRCCPTCRRSPRPSRATTRRRGSASACAPARRTTSSARSSRACAP